MKPTSRTNMERRLEALETKQTATSRTPELRLVLNKTDGTREVHILGQGGTFIVPAKMEPEEWAAKAQQHANTHHATSSQELRLDLT